MKGWRFKNNNRLNAYGEIDYNKRLIQVNKQKNKEPGELLDTLVHELMHLKYPKMKEGAVKSRTANKIKKMTQGEKAKIYKLVKNR